MHRTRTLFFCDKFAFSLILGLMLTSAQGHVLEFTVEPRDTTVVSGSAAVLDCVARSTEYPRAQITIQWNDQEQTLNFIGDSYRSQLSNGSLYISRVLEDQGLTGSYQCVATLMNVGSIVSKIATVSIATLSGFQQEPKDITVFPRQKAYFACRVQATPLPKVQWLKDERPLKLEELRMTVLPSGALEITDVQPTDQGTYRCNVSSLNQYRLSNKASLTISTEMDDVPSSPVFIAEPRSETVIEGQTVTLDCAAIGYPVPSVHWLKDGLLVDLTYLDSRLRKVGDSSLQITNVQELDAGTYQCRAENSEDSLDASATLEVQVPPRFLKKPEDKTDFINKDAEFECSIYGKPEPKIQWLKNGEVIKHNEYLQLVNGYNLKILGLMAIDAGIFQCVGSNAAGNIQASARLKIADRPTGRPNRKKYRNYSQTARSSTVVPDDTKPKIEKTQLHSILSSLKSEDTKKPSVDLGRAEFGHSLTAKEFTIDRSTNERINPHDVLISLVSSGKESTNLGDIQSAFTEPSPSTKPILLGESSAEQTSAPDGLPGRPQELKAVIVKARFVTLSWKPPEVTGGDIIAYSVYYRQAGSDRERVQNTTRSRLEEANIGSLTPSRLYTFRVVAYNSLGPGQSSDSVEVTTLGEEHVPTAPTHITAHATSPYSIHVSWSAPEIMNGPILKYQLYYMENSNSVEHSVDTTLLSYDLTRLSEYTEYLIWVLAVNVNGPGQVSSEVLVRTFGAAPTAPPNNVSLEISSSTSVVVRWEPPPLENQNGIITGYKIRYRKHGNKGDTVTTAGNARMKMLENLERSSNYQIRICAINVNGSGPPTDWMTISTYENDLDEHIVPESPLSLRVIPSSDSITAYWKPPLNQKIKVRMYVLGWGKGVPDTYVQNLDENKRHYVISNLESNSEYVISLRASNNIGPGPPVYEYVRTKNEAAPELSNLVPPVGLKASVISHTSVVLDWTDTTLSKNQHVTDNRYYSVRYGAVNNLRYRYFNATETNYMINDLKPNTKYEFAVKTVKGYRESPWSMVVHNTTWEAYPTAPRELIVKADENSQYVQLIWQPPKQPNGQITGYIIFYTTDNTLRDRDWLVQAVVGDKHSAKIHSLEPDTKYYFKIQARNNKGNGPLSSVVSFRTGLSNGVLHYDAKQSKEAEGFLSNTQIIYIVAGGTIVVVTISVLVILVLCCKRRDLSGTPDRSKKGYQKTKSQNIKPPDLWIHHDQMELKGLDKSHSSNDGASSSGAMTLPRSMGASEYDGRDPHPSNSLDKRTYVPSYVGVSPDDKNRRVIKPKPITLPVDSKPPREPVATATPINNGPGISAQPEISTRPAYPRTQYSMSRAHVTLDQNTMAGGQPNESPYSMQSSYDSSSIPSSYTSQPPPQAHIPQASTYAPGMSVLAESQGGKRLQGHPLKSFSVPAPPPTSAPGTPQPKHIVSSQVTVRPSSSPYKKIPSGATGTPTSRVSASNPPPYTTEEMQRLAPSYSTEELNQEMANLEGLMKDLNAITASEFEC